MRLIDSEPLLDMLEREENENEDIPNRSDGIRDAIIDILNAPTVEAVQVIRCKDCKYWDDFLDKGYCKDTIGFDRWWKPNDYCSYAERRTDETD